MAVCVPALCNGVKVNAWLIGSAVVQNTKPIPIPALNNMANHDFKENSGSSPSFPKVIDEYLENNK